MRIKSSILFLLIVGAMAPQSRGGLIGSNVIINPTGRFPDVAYGNGKYLVVWPEYSTSPAQTRGRFMTNAGAVSGSAFIISDTAFLSLYPSVCYNPTADEFLVSWDEEGRPGGDGIFGRRVSGATGLTVGASFRVSTIGVRSNAAWSSTSNVYLAVYHRALEVYGRRIDASGGLLGSEIPISNDPLVSLFAAVAYSSSGNQFLVTWDVEDPNPVADIRGRRIDAATGNLLASYISVTTNHHKNRSGIVYDPNSSRWLVHYNDLATPGNSYDQTGQFVDVNGNLSGSQIEIAASPAFEGDTFFGGDIALAPGLGRYFAAFQYNEAMGGQELSSTGSKIGGVVTLSSGPGESLSMATAADPTLNRFLVVWEYFDDPARSIRSQLFEASDLNPPAAPTNFTATPASGQLILNWTNPSDSDFAGTMIRYKLGSFPAHVNDGTLLTNNTNTPGSNDSHIHMGLSAGTYYYSAFAYDQNLSPNYSSASNTSGIPAAKGDFDVDTDVDQKDFAHLQKCFSGASVAYEAGCSDADFDVDGDVDGADFTVFDGCMRGANAPPGC